MRIAQRPVVATLALLVHSVFFTPAAHAACNAIPRLSSLKGDAPAPELAREQGLLPYRGALGRVDRADIAPSDQIEEAEPGMTVFEIGPDGCGAGLLVTKDAATPTKDDFIITIVLRDQDDERRPRVLQIAAPHSLVALNLLGNGDSRAPFVYVGAFPNDNVAIVAATAGDAEELRLRIGAPTLDQMGIVSDDLAPRLQNMRVIVTRPGQGPGLAELVQKTCAHFAVRAGSRPVACIDTIYSDYPHACAITASARDPFACHMGASSGARIDFGRQCFPGSGSNGKPRPCGQSPSEIAYLVDDCGNVRLRFDWTSIIRDDHSDKSARSLRGFSALSHDAQGTDVGIRIPGREFLGSTPLVSGGGNPHKPDFEPTPNSTLTRGTDLFGVADKDKSTLWVLPRMPATQTCIATYPPEACMGIDGEVAHCVCPDHNRFCLCEPIDPRYFACNDDDPDYRNQPCTRSSHCGNGRCNAPARCVPRGSVWSPQASPGGAVCTADGTLGGCASDDEQCGYALFELRNANGTKVVRTIDYTISGSDGTSRGFCARALGRTCGVASSEGCTLDDGTDVGPCIGYRFEAMGVVPPAPPRPN